MNEKTEMNESAVEELFQLAEEKRAATVNSKKFGPAWATIAEKLRNGGILTGVSSTHPDAWSASSLSSSGYGAVSSAASRSAS